LHDQECEVDNKRVLIQCAASKVPTAGFLKTQTGRRVKFVARPDEAPKDEWFYAQPDDQSDVPGQTWRQELERYNQNSENPLGLLKAYSLYENDVYRELVATLGAENVFILSAGWGIVSADYLLPDYDITFALTKPKHGYKRRHPQDNKYHDFCHLRCDAPGTLVTFCSKGYLPLFRNLTTLLTVNKIVFYAAADPPQDSGWRKIHFQTRDFRRWPYDCAREFLRGEISI
jgi:hypothetical protein